MPFFSPWITAVFIISLTFPFHSETGFNPITEVRKEPHCESYSVSICNKNIDKICASNGQTYYNICWFCSAKRMKNDTFSFLHYGACSPN
ncbi:sperm-associated acrosin inhibitor-like isoform X2 [Ochotona princeps]|nr:sperm-associated acrosin inhibitor-like isoform X2 [Ochotona princeps]XP_058533607.1 sperm-associated acrosin inhibitor-like isoform X2 [Ochotona princeps]